MNEGMPLKLYLHSHDNEIEPSKSHFYKSTFDQRHGTQWCIDRTSIFVRRYANGNCFQKKKYGDIVSKNHYANKLLTTTRHELV